MIILSTGLSIGAVQNTLAPVSPHPFRLWHGGKGVAD